MKPIYIIVILFFASYVMLGIALWLIKCKDLDLRKETYAKRILEHQYTNSQNDKKGFRKKRSNWKSTKRE